jgi:hypothetical protein
MSSHLKRWGGKLGGDHATAIEAAWRFLPEIIKEKSVAKISLGYISPLKSSSGRSSIKIIDDVNCILLSVRGAHTHQEIRVFSDEPQKAKLAIARAARNAQFHISFGQKQREV